MLPSPQPPPRYLAPLAALAVGTLLAALGLRSIWSVDYWWQWQTGAYVATHGVPHSDVFSYTNAGVPRLELRWLWCLGLHGLTAALGHGAAIVLKTLLLFLAFGLAAALAPWRRAPVLTGLVLMVAMLASSQRFMVRPEVLSLCLLMATVAAVEATRRGRRRAWLWVIPLHLLWVNVHGLFLLGPAVVGAWLASEVLGGLVRPTVAGDDAASSTEAPGEDGAPRRAASAGRWGSSGPAALALLASLGACLVNPYGWEALRLPLLQFGALHGTAQKGFFQELTSPFAFDASWTALRHYQIMLGAVGLSLLLALRRQGAFWLLLVGSQLYLSTTAIRNLPLFALVAVPYVTWNLVESPRVARLVGPRLRGTLRLAGLVLLLTFGARTTWQVVTNRFYVEQGDTNRFGLGLARHRYPERAVDALEASGVEGPLFHPPGIGSYLIARGYRVFIDPRGEQHALGVIDEYRRILDDPSAWPAWVDRYDFRAVLLDSGMFDLARALDRSPAWRLVHADVVALVYLRDDVQASVPALSLDGEAGVAWAARESAHLGRPPPLGLFTSIASPDPWRRLARLCLERGLHEAALLNVQRARDAWPPGFVDHELLGHAAAGCGQVAEAARAFGQVASVRPGDAVAQRRAAVAALNVGDPAGAQEPVQRLLEHHPEAAEGPGLAGLLALTTGRPGDAVSHLRLAASRAPDEATWPKHLGLSLSALARDDEARAALEQAWSLDSSDGVVARELAKLTATRDRAAARTWLARAEALLPGDGELARLRAALDD